MSTRNILTFEPEEWPKAEEEESRKDFGGEAKEIPRGMQIS